MLKKLAPIALLYFCFGVNAQVSNTSEAEGVAPIEPPKVVERIPAVWGVAKEFTVLGTEFSSYGCGLQGPGALSAGASVVVVRKVQCKHSRFAELNRDYWQILHLGELRLAAERDLALSEQDAARISGLPDFQVEANLPDWRLTSEKVRSDWLTKIRNAMDATSRHGIALLNAEVFDVSRSTEATGFRATVYNSGKKTIKYVNFVVMGLNAVGDPIPAGGPLRTAGFLRGIGPILPGAQVSYAQEFMWHTDAVQKIRMNIKLDYMDGTSKVVTDMKSILIDPKDSEFYLRTSR